MVRKTLCLVVLIAMVTHCASRVGALWWLYEKRHAIAFSMGMIKEIPIAVCSSQYDFDRPTKIESQDEARKMPVLVQAQDINLFFVPRLSGHPHFATGLTLPFPIVRGKRILTTDPTDVFHPPLV